MLQPRWLYGYVVICEGQYITPGRPNSGIEGIRFPLLGFE